MKSYNSKSKKRSLHNKKTKLNIKTKKSSKKFNKNGMKGGELTDNNISKYKNQTEIDLSDNRLNDDDVDKIIELLKPKLKLNLSTSSFSNDNIVKIINAAIEKKLDTIIFTDTISGDDFIKINYANSYSVINPKKYYYGKPLKIIFNLLGKIDLPRYYAYTEAFKNINFGNEGKYIQLQEEEYRRAAYYEHARAQSSR